mgnify:FL=1
MKKFDRVKAVVSLDAIAHNFEEMKKNIAEETKIVAVIKADGYGHGAEAIARLIEDYEYIWGFATATPEEALQLRDAGIDKPILILGIVFEEYYKEPGTLKNRIIRYVKTNIGKGGALNKLDTLLGNYSFCNVQQAAESIDWSKQPLIEL